MKSVNHRSPLASLLALLTALAAAGCTPPPEFPLGDPRGIQATDPVSIDELFPLAPRRGAFVVTDGKQTGQVFDYTLARTGDLWHFELTGKQDTFYAATDDGTLGIAREDDAASAVRVDYDPPIVTPAHLEVGRPYDGRTHMAVHRLANGALRDQGECTYRVELLGWQFLTMPAGAYEARVVRTTRQINLRFAKVRVVILDAYDPEGGPVAQRVEQTIWTLGLVCVRSHEELRLAR
jgi:hypothetical protein